MCRYDRETLYEEGWSHPVQEVAKLHGISAVRLGKMCCMLQAPVPPRDYWARLRASSRVANPSLPKLETLHRDAAR